MKDLFMKLESGVEVEVEVVWTDEKLIPVPVKSGCKDSLKFALSQFWENESVMEGVSEAGPFSTVC